MNRHAVRAQSPEMTNAARDVSRCGVGEWAWVELNYRPHAYQACALTT